METFDHTVEFCGFEKVTHHFEKLYQSHNENICLNNEKHQSALTIEKNQYDALQLALSSLSGLLVSNITLNNNSLQIECNVKKCSLLLVLSATRQLISIENRSEEFKWINFQSLLIESQSYEPPNDVRYAVFAIASAQESRSLLQKHASEFRKVCIVQYFSPYRVKFTYKNGMTVTIQASESYPQVPGCLQVMEIDYFSLSIEEKFLENLKLAANNKCFCQLREMYDFFDQYKDL